MHRLARLTSLAAAVALALVVFALGAAPASAARCGVRWVPGLFGGPGSMVPVCDHGPDGVAPRAQPRKPAARQRRPTQAQYRALRYRATPRVSAQVFDRLVQTWSQGEDVERMRTALAGSNLLPQADRAMRRLGWSTRDLGDAYAHAYLVMWSVVNGRPEVSEAATKAIRADVRTQFALDPRIRRAKDSAKQATAEWLSQWAVLLAATHNIYNDTGTPADLRAWRDRARDLAAEEDLLGVDLSKVRLTRRGIVAR